MIFSKDYSHLLLIPEGKEGAIAIPGSTKFIPAQALSLCQSGSSLSAGDGSTAFATHDGMLFSKDLKNLVAVPSAYGKAVVLPVETKAIGEYALAGCKELASITVLGNIQKIDSTAFADEVKASAVVALPAGNDYEARKSIWEKAGFQRFAEPAQPGATTTPDASEASGLTYTLLDDYTLAVSWQGKDDTEANLEIPASAEINGVPYRVSTIAENAFANCGSFTSVKLPSTITSIGNGAFAGCANLSTIDFPNTLRTIGERAFEATSLKDVWLPASINTIGSRAFASCSTLERVVALGTPEVASDALAGCTNVSIYVPSGSEAWNPGLPSDNNHLMPYGVSLSEESLTIEAGQEADLLEGGNLQAPDPVEASYSYAAAPLSVDAGQVSAKKAGTSDVTAVLTLDDVELTRASRTVEVSPNPEAESDIALMNTSSSLPAAYLAEARNNQISVTAPTQVILGDGNGYDVATKPECATGTAIFKNNSTGQSVRLDSVSCTSSVSIESNIQTLDTSRSLNTQRIFSLYPKGNEDAAVHFGYGDGVNYAAPTNKDAFGIASSASAPYTFRLNLTNKIELANAKVTETGVTSSGKTVTLATVMCTFAGFTFTPTGHGVDGDNVFYLKDTATGKVYSLADVKAHAQDISNKGKGSLYYSMYADYSTDDTKYECKSTWTSGTYDLRIIGVLHDDKASGGKAGLTVQFKNLLNEIYQMNIEPSTNAGGWGQSQLRARMNPASLPNQDNVIANSNSTSDDDAIWNQVPADLQNSIEVVKKKYQPTYNSSTSTIKTSDDKLFIASYSELVPSSHWDSTHWTAQEGTQYAYWHKKVTQNYGANGCLKKVYQQDATPEPPQKGVYWWERSVTPTDSTYFLFMNTYGDPSSYSYASKAYGVCPCFCL